MEQLIYKWCHNDYSVGEDLQTNSSFKTSLSSLAGWVSDITFFKFCFLFSAKKLNVQAYQKLCMGKSKLNVGPYGIFLNNEIPHKFLCDLSQWGRVGVSEKRHNDVFKGRNRFI